MRYREPDGSPVPTHGPPPDMSLGVLLFIPYRHMEQRILDAVVAAGYPITLSQARLFQRVDHSGSRLTQLAESAQVTKQAAGFLVSELAHLGYVERGLDPTDGRARLIHITALGYETIAVALRTQHAIEAEWTRHLGAHRLAELTHTLAELRKITDPFA